MLRSEERTSGVLVTSFPLRPRDWDLATSPVTSIMARLGVEDVWSPGSALASLLRSEAHEVPGPKADHTAQLGL